jgi:hypothetical protein
MCAKAGRHVAACYDEVRSTLLPPYLSGGLTVLRQSRANFGGIIDR